ncbi:Glucosamine-6-phosphate isomerase (Glucosamine-6-phosphate deaminase) (GNPDA) (GlcN6P deaminase) [Stygiomarasmius scandens]|uniref:Beta-hexosaminidase n=1 Tax=Marasmiellus scandens TaxID=2682957 RepID=A0ABR1IMY0_9AGAR
MLVKVPIPFVVTALSIAGSVSALWPLPKQLSTGTTTLKLADDFDISLDGIYGAPQDLVDAVSRAKDLINNDKLERLVPDRGASDADAVSSAPALSGLALSFDSGFSGTARSLSEEATDDLESRVEAYSLTVPADGSQAVLKANSTLGLFRGLTTFTQLWYELNGTTYSVEAPIEIVDEPAYPYRGLMLDTARNFFPVADIKRTLDAMSWVKINTFHWHIVDSQSFALELPEFPEISAAGAYSSAMVYSAEDVKDILSYAAARGIDVLPEIDTPGHTSVISKAFPEHIACAEAAPWASFANEPPAGQLRLASPSTINFTQSLFASASSLFTGKLFSSGGDEINQNCYDKDNQTQSDLTASGKTFEEALDTFTQATHRVLHDNGKRVVVWEEMVLEHNVTLANDTVVMVWISSANAASVAKSGHKFVHAASDFFYLDCGGGGWVGANPGGNSWCDPFKTWQKSYSFDPKANLTEEEGNLVLGGQHLLWTEQSSRFNLDPIVWPRAASSAELFWSGEGGDGEKALPRLHDLAYRLNQRGVGAIALQPMYCALRPGVCDLTA